MKITDYVYPKLRIVENFVSKEDCDWFINYTKEKNIWSEANASRSTFGNEEDYLQVAKQWDDRKIDFNNLYLNKSNPELFKHAYPIKERAKEQVADFFNLSKESFWIESWEAVRWYYPYQQHSHIDYIDPDFDRSKLPEGFDSSFFTSEQEHLYRTHCTTKHYTGMIYMNDDFEGGELFFPYHDNFEIKPKPGMLVIFSGNIFNPHGIKQITEGTRYVHTTFWNKSIEKAWPIGGLESINSLDKFWEK